MTDPMTAERDEIMSWTGPPAHDASTKYLDYRKAADQMRERPGEWARLGDRSSPSAAYQFAVGVRRGRPVAFNPAGDFEGAFQGRSVYVRYVGEGAASSDAAVEFVDGHVESDTRSMPAAIRAQLHADRDAVASTRQEREAPDPSHLFSL